MLDRQLTDDARAILLLCARFSTSESDTEALTTREYNTLAEWLLDNDLRPGDLLSRHGREQLRDGILTLDLPRVERLLDRGVAMALDTEKWLNKGIWALCRSDKKYPTRLRAHLQSQAPPFLYCAGDVSLLEAGGLAIVGSRDIQPNAERFTRQVARRSAEFGISIVSGGARGVDQIAMLEALDAGGRCTGILADSLSRAVIDSRYRDRLLGGRLLLCSPYRPDTGFNTGLAMGRNKLVYAMADNALVIQADKDKGGTWNGAKEELRRSNARPVFVRIEQSMPEGNRALLTLGATPFPSSFFEMPPLDALLDAAIPDGRGQAGTSASHAATVATTCDTQSGTASADSPEQSSVRPDTDEGTEIPRANAGERSTLTSDASLHPDLSTASAISTERRISDAAHRSTSATILDAVRPLLLSKLVTPCTLEELASELDVNKAQLDAWLKEMVHEKSVKRLTRPVRYIRIAQIEFQTE